MLATMHYSSPSQTYFNEYDKLTNAFNDLTVKNCNDLYGIEVEATSENSAEENVIGIAHLPEPKVPGT